MIGVAESRRGSCTTFPRLVSWVETSIEPGGKRVIADTVLTDSKLWYVPVIFSKCASISLLETEFQVHEILTAQYPADLEKSAAEAPEDVASIGPLADDLQRKAD